MTARKGLWSYTISHGLLFHGGFISLQSIDGLCSFLAHDFILHFSFNITSFKNMLRAKRSEAKLASNRGKLRFEVYSRMAAKMFVSAALLCFILLIFNYICLLYLCSVFHLRIM